MLERAIPSTGVMLPVVGLGTYRGFDKVVGTPEYSVLPAVIDSLTNAGGSVIDSSPMYGRAESSVGEIVGRQAARANCFLATKVWTTGKAAGRRQMEQSFSRLGTASIDLMQVHNLVGYDDHIGTLREWKAAGRIRYLGISHYTSAAYADVEAVLRQDRLDFLQINYSLEDRFAEKRLLPLAAERGVAVLVNMPFGGGSLIRSLRSRSLPQWATEIGCTSWEQVLLKFVLSHPAVTCVIPGTGSPEHMASNAQAGKGDVPDLDFWRDKVDIRVF